MWKKTTALFFPVFFLLQLTVVAQPVCKDSLPASLLLNPSFEEHGACNLNWRGEGGIIDGSSSAVYIEVPHWHPENNWQYIRYYSYDCKRPTASIFDLDYTLLKTGFPGIPLPLPAGKGLVAIEQDNISRNASPLEKQTNKKYVTACLTSPLQQGKAYGFAFDLGFGRFNPNFNDLTGFWASPSPFSVGIFGRTDCPSFPINRPADSAAGCLADRSGWIPLGEISMRGNSAWVRGYIEFTAPGNISSIGIGPSCNLNENIKDTFALYYLDNLVLSQKEDFAFASITALSGNACTGHYVLEAPYYINSSYQWYIDGKIIPNAVEQRYTVPDAAAGNYSVNINLPGNCFTSLPFAVSFSPVRNLTLGSNRILCDSITLRLDAKLTGVDTYQWQDGSKEPVFTATASGNYTVRATDPAGCSNSATVNLSFTDCSRCKILFPGAFTPDHNGLNDFFRPKTLCREVPLLSYRIVIYNRWGQPVFTSTDPAAGWDGSFRQVPAPQSVYVYMVEYSFFPGQILQAKGTVLLVR